MKSKRWGDAVLQNEAFGLKKNNVVHQTLLHGNLTYTRVEGTNKGEGPKEVN